MRYFTSAGVSRYEAIENTSLFNYPSFSISCFLGRAVSGLNIMSTYVLARALRLEIVESDLARFSTS